MYTVCSHNITSKFNQIKITHKLKESYSVENNSSLLRAEKYQREK